MNSILQIFYSIISGALLAFAIPNELLDFGTPVLAFFALIPYYLAIKNAKSYKVAFWCGFFQTLTTHLVTCFWLANFKDFAALTLGGTALGTAIIGGIFSQYFYLPNTLFKNTKLNRLSYSKKFIQTPSFRVIYFSFVYTIYEWCKSTGFLGCPWGTIPIAMFNWPEIRQIVDITGTYGITLLVVFCNALVTELFTYLYDLFHIESLERRYQHLQELHSISVTYILLMVCTLIYGTYQYTKIRTPEKKVTSILVQQNLNPWDLLEDEASIVISQRLTREKMEELKNQGKKADLVVWSEGVLTVPHPTSRYKHFPDEDPLIPFIQEIGVPFVLGGPIMETYEFENDYYNKFCNSALVFDKFGELRGSYAKLHLVPFAEILPFNDNPFVRSFLMKAVGISAGWAQGDQLITFEVPCKWYDEAVKPFVYSYNIAIPYEDYKLYLKDKPTVKISAPICFDDAFTDVMRPMFKSGAELFVNMSDDSWSLKKSSEYQHFVIASYRAIEYRTTLVRSTNAGYSVVVDPSGKVIFDMPLFEETADIFDIPVYGRTETIYAKLGNWLPYTLVFLFFIFCGYAKKEFKPSDFIPSERKNRNLKSKKHKK